MALFGQNGEFSQLSYLCQDGVERPYIVYTPASLDKTSDKPLLIYLHGAISNPQLKKTPLEYMKKSKLVRLADEGGFYLMFSYGQKGATWFDAVGTDMVLEQMKLTQKQFNIDKNKIFLSGFSDGGSGALYFSTINPGPFAGFIAMNGSLKVAQKLGEQAIFPANSNQKPIYIINTTQDMLYPINQIEPVVNYLKKFNQNITFKTPIGNHEMSYLEELEKENILAFIQENSNHELTKITWETLSLKNTNLSWLTITQIDTLKPPEEWHKPYHLEVFNDKADFGLKYDYSFPGPGLKVNGFKSEDCTAKNLGIQEGDIILMMEKDTMKSPYSPYYYIANKTAGDSTSLDITRGVEQMVINGKFNNGYFYPIFDKINKSAKIKANIKGTDLMIYTSRVSEISIDTRVIKHFNLKSIYINGTLYPSDLEGLKTIPINLN